MLFILTLIILVFGIIAGIISDKFWKLDWLQTPAIISIVLGSICFMPLTIELCSSYIGVDGSIAKNQARYESLVYQYDNNVYDNDNDLGKRDLMEDIQKWNEDLAWHKENQDDFWIGIFIPNIYDQFDFIELKGE